MSYDSLTITALIIVGALIIMMVVVARSRANTEHKMRLLARHLTMMQSNEDARALCRKIHEKYPHLCAGLDFTFKKDRDGVEIDEWHAKEPRPQK